MDTWNKTADNQPAPGQVVLIWLQGAYNLAYLNRGVWYAVDRYRQGSTIGVTEMVKWWAALPGRPE
jgi:hypothetical protein